MGMTPCRPMRSPDGFERRTRQMSTSPAHRSLAALALLLVAALGVVPAGAQEDPASDDRPTPGVPVPDDSELGVVHSWALAPAGAGDGSQSGDRANLTYRMAPGTLVQDRVTLFNFSNVPLEFELIAIDAENNDDGAFTPVDPEQEQTGVGVWVTLPVDTLAVPAGQAASFDIVVNVPRDARPGDHAGVILAANDARGTSADGRIVTTERQTGTRVYIRVEGELTPELAVAEVRTDYTAKLNPLDGSADVTYRIENRGNVRLAGTHQVSISGPFGLLESSGPLHELPELLPGESIEFTETIDDVAATVAAFTDVELEAITVDGSNEAVDAADRRAIGLAVPFAVIAALVVAAFVWVARTRYRKHGQDVPPSRGDVIDDDLLEPQPT